MCKRESSAKFEDKSPTLSYSADHNGQFAPFLTIDCRGLEFVGFDPTRVRFNQFFLCRRICSNKITGNLEMRWRGVWHGVSRS